MTAKAGASAGIGLERGHALHQDHRGRAQPFPLHISSMAPNKNIEALLDLAGATSTYTATVQQMITTRGLRNVVQQLDLAEAHKTWLYAYCTGFLFPSLAEGFGLPRTEAMHFSKPVFLSRRTLLPEVGSDLAHYTDEPFHGAAMRTVV